MSYQPPRPNRFLMLWSRYRALRQGPRRAIGCLALIVALLLCGTISGVINAASRASSSNAASPTATTAVQKIVATATPTTAPVKLTATPRPKPTVKPTSAPVVATTVPTQAVATGVNGNPWGYDFSTGNLIYNPNTNFCSYFACVSTFWSDTSGYVVECGNGEYSHSGGVRGACSRDGDVSQILYSH